MFAMRRGFIKSTRMECVRDVRTQTHTQYITSNIEWYDLDFCSCALCNVQPTCWIAYSICAGHIYYCKRITNVCACTNHVDFLPFAVFHSLRLLYLYIYICVCLATASAIANEIPADEEARGKKKKEKRVILCSLDNIKLLTGCQ